VPLLGAGVVALGPAIDWHRDPVSGERAPQRFWADYDLVHDEGPDPKILHELNRHGHLPLLARAYYWTGDEAYAREAVDQMLSWTEQNPERVGVHWHSSLEIALRAISWMTTLSLLGSSHALDESSAPPIFRSLCAQLLHVRRHPSIYSSPNTHLIGEATALFMAGCLLPKGTLGASFLRTGARLLAGAAASQVGADGVYGELSTYYHAYALDFFLLAAALAERSRHPLLETLTPRIGPMADFLAAIASPRGAVPLLGDDDGGAAFTLAGSHYGDVRPLLSSAAVLLGRQDLYRAGATSHAVWLFGPARVGELEAHAARGPGRRARPGFVGRAFPDGGYFVQDLASGERHARLLFDAGGLGISSGGHGHADALSVLLEVDGRPFLIDPGTFVYNRAPEWRNHFRGTAAHNTVSVDGRDQSEPGDTFAWERLARVVARPPVERRWCAYLEGEHDGYLRLKGGVRHRRRVLAIVPEYWVIVDELWGQGAHRATWHYHLAPDLVGEVQSAEGVTTATLRGAEGLAGLTLAASASGEARLVTSQWSPLQGWASSRYGEKTPAPVLEVTVEGPLPIVAVTVIQPWQAAPALRVERQPGAVVVRRAQGEQMDTMVVNRRGKDVVLPEGSVDDGFLWLRSERGVVGPWVAAARGTVRAGEAHLDGARGAVVTGRGCNVDG
jgi:hypothetical protein